MQIIKPPGLYDPAKEEGISIFLAGSIEMDTAEDWQKQTEERFAEYDHVTFLNPRRDDWNPNIKQSIDDMEFYDQVSWEMKNLEDANFVFMYFSPGTISPISLLELGAFGKSDKMLVCCPDEYFRRGNVEIFCQKFKIPFTTTLESAFEYLEKLVKVYQHV